MKIHQVNLKLSSDSYDLNRIITCKKDLCLNSGAFVDKDLPDLGQDIKSLCWAVSAATGLAIGQVEAALPEFQLGHTIKDILVDSIENIGIKTSVLDFEDKPTIAQLFRNTSGPEYGPLCWFWDGKVWCSWREFFYGLNMPEPEPEDCFSARRGRIGWVVEMLG